MKVSLELNHEQPIDSEIARRLEEAPLSEADFATIESVLKQAGTRTSEVSKALKESTVKEQGAVRPTPAEYIEVRHHLIRYKRQYDGSGNSKLKAVPWATIQARILEDADFQLIAALDLERGGELFGIDVKGNPLISDGGDEPVMKGMNYPDTRARVLFKHTSNDKTGKIIKGDNGQPVATGYEMFGYVKPYGKSDEILQYEAHTGKKLVQKGGNWRSSWLESGENPSRPRYVRSIPSTATSDITYTLPHHKSINRGVRRLLRVKPKKRI